jgi:P4 family phage/plasmid primase-like protien
MVRIVFTEGEKKAAKADQEGIRCIGLVGVFSFTNKGKLELSEDLKSVNWERREVRICFDSDFRDNENVQKAIGRLASYLKSQRAFVKVIYLPGGPSGEKVGLDDFLITHGRGEFERLSLEAEEPDPVDSGDEKSDNIDPMTAARLFLDDRRSSDGELKIRYFKQDFWEWTGQRYRVVPEESDLRPVVHLFLDNLQHHLTRSNTTNVIEGIRALSSVDSLVELPRWIGKADSQRNCITLENGILDLDLVLSGATSPIVDHTPLWFSQVCLPYEFDPAATCPRWFEALIQSLDGDLELVNLLQEWFGYQLQRGTDQQKFAILIGEGGTGKSSTCAALHAMLGAENVSSVSLDRLGERFELHRMLGKLANISAETEEITKVSEGRLKQLTSGDPTPFEEKNKPIFDATPTAKLTFAMNNLPRFTDRSSGLWRRMILIPFDHKIPADKIVPGMDKADWWVRSGELPGILNWAIEGLKRLNSEGFTASPKVSSLLENYRNENNPARAFLLRNYREDPQGKVVTRDLYDAYKTECSRSGHHPLHEQNFGREVSRTFPGAKKSRFRIDGELRHGYQGICEGGGQGDCV